MFILKYADVKIYHFKSLRLTYKLNREFINYMKHTRLFIMQDSFLIIITIVSFILSFIFDKSINLSSFFLYWQDRWLLLIISAILFISLLDIKKDNKNIIINKSILILISVSMIILLSLGNFLILSSYNLSRDEQMAVFDAAVFSRGHLVENLPSAWRGHADALNTLFMYPAEHRRGWISSYLPMNSAIRAFVGFVLTPWLTGPLITAGGIVAIWRCAKQIWPNDAEAPSIAVILYIGSSQILITGMTAYAMPAHLTLNLIWLSLFLQKKTINDIFAIFIAFVTVGLHQPLFHSVFAGPFILLMFYKKEWKRASLYVGSYIVICAFWLWWPNWIWTLVETDGYAKPAAGVDYFTRLTNTLFDPDPSRWPVMLANFLRFIAWQHIILFPLLILGVKYIFRNPLASALAASVLLTACIMAIILPSQGHGFGYRYFHGLIGNCILLAVFGWVSLCEQRGQWRILLKRTTIGGLVILLPVQTWMAHSLYSSVANVSHRIDNSGMEYVIIGNNDAPFSRDLVYNSPLLDKKPIRLRRDRINDSFIHKLCIGQPLVGMVGDKMLSPINKYYGWGVKNHADINNNNIITILNREGCKVSILI